MKTPILVPAALLMMNLFTRDDKLPLEYYFHQFALRAYMYVYIDFFLFPSFFLNLIWLFSFAVYVCAFLFCFIFEQSPLPLQVPSFTGNKLLHSNTSEKSVCTWLYVYANMVHLNIYFNRTVDATRIWLIWDRNLCHNFKLKEWSNIQQQKQHLSMFAYSLSASIARSLTRSLAHTLPHLFAWLNRVHRISTNFRTFILQFHKMFDYKNAINFE